MRNCATTLEAEMTTEEHDFLLELIRDRQFTGQHLEVGTAAGGTLCAMMKSFAEQSRPQFVVVDRMTYFPDQMETVRQNLQNHQLDPDTLDFRVATSAAAFAAAEKSGDRFDFILLDGNHKILAVMADLRWTRLLNPGGIICLHDYSHQFPGVYLSVERFLARNPNYDRVGQAGSLLAIQKARQSARSEVTSLDRVYSMAMHIPLQAKRKLTKWSNRRKAVA